MPAIKKVSSILYKVLRIQNKNTKYDIRNTKYLLRYTTLFIALVVISFGALRLFQTSDTAAWYSDNWAHRKTLTIDADQVSGTSNLENFPVLVSITSDQNLSDNAQADGDDILFTDKTGTKLDHEIESYASGTLVAWVRIPSLSPTQDTDIYMYYGNSQTSNQQNPTGVWDENYQGVWHLDETATDEATTADLHQDSTSNNNDGDQTGNQNTASGKIGTAQDFDGTNDYIEMEPTVANETTYTISAWYQTTRTTGQDLYSEGSSSSVGPMVRAVVNRNSSGQIGYEHRDDSAIFSDSHYSLSVNNGAWHYVSITRENSNTYKVYSDGNGNISSDIVSPGVTTVDRAGIGALLRSSISVYFDGIIDEVRTSSTARSADWIATEYANQNDPSSFFSISSQQSRTRGPVLHLKLDEGHGPTAQDSTSNDNDGTISGATWKETQSCISDKCLDFDGSNDQITITDDNTIDLTNEGTIQTWLRPHTTSTDALDTISSWTSLTAPDGISSSVGDFSTTDIVVVGEKIYYVSYLHNSNTEYFYTAFSDLNGDNFSGWTSQSAPNGVSMQENTSVAIDSDGSKLYYSAFTHDDATEKFYVSSSNLDGTGFEVWTELTAPNGADSWHISNVDMVIVNNKMYFAAYLHCCGVIESGSSTESFFTANSNLDGSSFSGWNSHAAPDGAGVRENTAITIESEGKYLYYATLANSQGTEAFYTASSDLDGSNFSSWTSRTAPDGGGDGDASNLSMTIAGNKLYIAAFMQSATNETFSTSTLKTDGSNFSGWTVHTNPDGGGNGGGTDPAVATDGKKIYFIAFSYEGIEGSTESYKLASLDLPNAQPLISKSGAYELIQNGGGFTLDWSGVPYSFGDIDASIWNHVSVSHDGTNLNMYLNGNLQRIQATTIDFTSNSNNLLIASNGTNYYDGELDEIKIYPYARTTDEIKQDYNQSATTLGLTSPSESLSQGLVGYWTMEDNVSGDAQTITDKSGNGNPGTTVDGANDTGMDCTTGGKFGYGCEFDGSDDYVNVGDVNIYDFDATQSFSVSAWIKTSTSDGYYGIISKRQDVNVSNQGWSLQQRVTTSRLQFGIADNSSNGLNLSSTTTYTDGNWHHLVGLVDRDTQKAKLFIDGQLIDSGSINSIGSLANTRNVEIGKISNSNYWPGKIDEVRIYNRALSASEVQSLYRYAPGPVAYYNFDEGSGTTLNDRSGNGNTGTLLNGPQWSTGKYGGSIEFSPAGDTETIEVTSSSSLEMSHAVTVEAWFNTSFNDWEGGSGHSRIVDKYDKYFIGYNESNDKLVTWVYAGGTRSTNLASDNIINDGLWHHAALVYDGATVSLYVDGMLNDSASKTGTLATSANPFTIGNWYSENSDTDFAGKIDEVRIYNYARTQDQIIEDMNAGHPAIGTPVGSSVLHLSMDEGHGEILNDKSPQNNNGDLAGSCPGAGTCPSWTNDGKFGKALSFDGGDYATVTAATSINNLSELSFSTWFRPTTIGVQQVIANKSTNAILYLDASNNFSSYAGGSQCNSSTTVSANNWHHGIFTYDATNVKLYLDGNLVATCARTYTTGTDNLYIGADNTPSQYFTGQIDETKMYPFALTADQVAIEYNQGKQTVLGSTGTDSSGNPSNSSNRAYCVPGDTSTCNPPVLELNFEENTATTAYDTSTNGHNSTLSGATWTVGQNGAGSALSFDGNDIGTISLLNPYNYTNFTLSSWYKSADTTVGKPGSVDDEYIYSHKSGDQVILGITDDTNEVGKARLFLKDGSNSRRYYGTSVINDQQWHNITAVRDSTTIYIYVDGQLETQTADLDAGATLALTNSAYIGDDGGIPGPLHGNIDQLKLYDYARTPAQIAWDYNKGAPVAHYKLDECQGTTAHDSSTHANHGTIIPGAAGNTATGTCSSGSSTQMWANGASGIWNASLDFDSQDDYISVPDNDLFSFGNGTTDKEFTLAAWIKPDNFDDTFFIINKRDRQNNTDSEWDFYIKDNSSFSTPMLVFRSPNGGRKEYSTTTSIHTMQSHNGWYHIVASYTGTLVNFYVNGIPISASFFSSAYTAMDNLGQDLLIGKINDTADQTSNGQIDDVRIYNYALTSEQVKLVHNNGAINFQ